ncbi:hypothetical protein AB4Z09_27740 [Rhodococcus sp. TAF43]|uniref:hypothetical protein n=1 Tax=Rhodococcus sp. TAF43 TaxID=3237483 RepID=UPI003F97B8D6
MTHVVVVGAGYAGGMAANRVASAGISDVVVTVINPRWEFVERIRLHQYAAGSGPQQSHWPICFTPLSGFALGPSTGSASGR